jgi:cell wall-associated NlpC family hydrolase
VQKLIAGALELAKLNLVYRMGSDNPAGGGMDCSGAVSYLLREQGFKDVPRDASGQYTWARKHGQFFAVVSKKAGGFEFAELLPGDLMFWSGTYESKNDPPVTHSMIYLGVQRKRGQHVMWGSSEGRSFDGKPRNGVSVFDFQMPRVDPVNGSRADFLGYARIPGLRQE